MPALIADPEKLAGDHDALNLAVWERVLGDGHLQALAYRIESDRYGQIVMSPPPAPEHGREQFNIGKRLDALMPDGEVITECPISTPEGVKAADVCWISNARWAAQRGKVCQTTAPEICVEVVSPGHSEKELVDKRALFFAAGAEEVWFCRRNRKMEFYLRAAPHQPAASVLCPAFPNDLQGTSA